MLKVAAADFQRDVGRYQAHALKELVAVMENGCEHTVLLSIQEYERLKSSDREVLGLEDFTLEDVVAIRAARTPEEAKEYNHEVT